MVAVVFSLPAFCGLPSRCLGCLWGTDLTKHIHSYRTVSLILQFKHPSEDYSIKYELLDDFYIDGLAGNDPTVIPKCRILTWQFNSNEFWDFERNASIVLKKPIEDSIKQIKDTLISNVRVPLNIDNDIFLKNTTIVNSIWTLDEIINESGDLID